MIKRLLSCVFFMTVCIDAPKNNTYTVTFFRQYFPDIVEPVFCIDAESEHQFREEVIRAAQTVCPGAQHIIPTDGGIEIALPAQNDTVITFQILLIAFDRPIEFPFSGRHFHKMYFLGNPDYTADLSISKYDSCERNILTIRDSTGGSISAQLRINNVFDLDTIGHELLYLFQTLEQEKDKDTVSRMMEGFQAAHALTVLEFKAGKRNELLSIVFDKDIEFPLSGLNSPDIQFIGNPDYTGHLHSSQFVNLDLNSLSIRNSGGAEISGHSFRIGSLSDIEGIVHQLLHLFQAIEQQTDEYTVSRMMEGFLANHELTALEFKDPARHNPIIVGDDESI